MTSADIPETVLRFLQDRIDSVSHLEALLLIWSSGGKCWTDQEVAERVYVARDTARSLLQDLVRHRLLTLQAGSEPTYCYHSQWDVQGDLMDKVAHTYQRHLVRIANLIHDKASPAVRDFARAFDFKSK